MTVLSPVQQVDFDPANEEHVKAMVGLLFQHKQHETLRFRQSSPVDTVPIELSLKFIAHHLPDSLKTIAENRFSADKINPLLRV